MNTDEAHSLLMWEYGTLVHQVRKMGHQTFHKVYFVTDRRDTELATVEEPAFDRHLFRAPVLFEYFDKLGKDGWEVCFPDGEDAYIFKRPVRS